MTNRRSSPRLHALLAPWLVLFAAAQQLPPSIDLVDINNPPPGVLILKPEAERDLAGELWSPAEMGLEGHRTESKRAAFGDFDGDGLTDIAVGSPRMDIPPGQTESTKAGIAHIVFGRRGFQSLPAHQRRLNLLDTFSESGQADVVIRRQEIGDALGYCVAAGDLNGDGYDDLILAAPKADQKWFFQDPEGDGRENGGVVYVLFGSPHLRSPGGVTEIDLTPVLGTVLDDPTAPCGGTVPGVAGFASLPAGVHAKAILGAYGGDQTGVSVATGDFDNDGFPDLVICAMSARDLGGLPPEDECWNGGDEGGVIWVVYGGGSLDDNEYLCNGEPRPLDRIVDLRGPAVAPGLYSPCGTLEQTGHTLITGRRFYKGRFISAATGDVNGDGIADVIAGTTSGYDPPASGAWAFYGNSLRSRYIDLRDLPGSAVIPDAMAFGVTLLVATFMEGSAGTAGDLNGDGVDDIVVGSPSEQAGRAFIVLSRLDENQRPRKPGDRAGSGTILDLPTSSDVLTLLGVEGAGGAKDQTGASTGTGDLDGDGWEDLLLGSPFAPRFAPLSVRSGRLPVLNGATLPEAVQSISLVYGPDDSNPADPAQSRVRSTAEFDYIGGAISAAGDLDDDGFPDMAAVATGTTHDGTSMTRGYVAVVFGVGGIAGSGTAREASRPRYSAKGNPPANYFGPTIRAAVNWESGEGPLVFEDHEGNPEHGSVGPAGESFDVFEIDREFIPPPDQPTIMLSDGVTHQIANTLWNFTSERDSSRLGLGGDGGRLGDLVGFPTARFWFEYLDSEIADATGEERDFRIAMSVDGGPWQLLDSLPIQRLNRIVTMAPI